MEAKKFRIGNLILIHDCLQEIIELPLPENCTDKNTKGINLTDEWIDKFGFDDSDYKKGYTGIEFRTNMIMDFVLTKPKFMGEWQESYCFDLGQHRFVTVKYVHELQNLFFAVTTTELEMKQDISACS
jgi:hypothetical protein